MDTVSFLRLIVPDSGIKFVAEWVPRPKHPKGGVMLHHPVGDFDDMADKLAELDRNGKKQNVYYAMASYKEVVYREIKGFTFPAGRTQDNALQVKALWQDFDVKDAEFAYGSREEAVASLKSYLEATGMPTPLVVSSGYGLHVYWVFDEPISPDEWTLIARLQRAAMKHVGVKFDPAADKDCARVLRAPGCHNYKNPDDPKLVKVVTKGEYRTLPAAAYKRILQEYVMENDVPVAEERLPRSNLSAGEPEYPPSYLSVAAEHCAQLRFFKNGGTASEPVWYAMLGVAKHCEDGQELAHKFSESDERYDEEVCQAKFEQWSMGPTTCLRFRELCSERCEGCSHEVKSPIQLGHVVENTEPEITTEVDGLTGEVKEVELVGWPAEASFRNGRMCWAVTDDEGVVNHIPFAYPKFYVLDRVTLEDGTAALHIRVEHPTDGCKEFDLPFKALADAKRGAKPALMAYGITVINEVLAMNNLLSYKEKLENLRKEVNTFKQFGWTEDRQGFLIGNKLISKEPTRTVRLDGRVSGELHNIYSVRGTKEEWISGVDRLYNRPRMEPYQYVICAAFGAVISPIMMDDKWHGIPLALTSGRSGYGKTTICQIAANAFYNSAAATVTDSTVNALLARASNMNNLPMIYDEITTHLKDPVNMSDVLYGLSNGRGRVRLGKNGKELETHPSWNLMSFLTGNKNVIFNLTESKLNPEASQMRVFEVDMDSYPRLEQIYRSELPDMLELSNHLLNNTKGVLTEEFIRFVMVNQGAIQAKLQSTFNSIVRKLGDNITKERFYAYHIACTLVGGAIAKNLGFLNFDMRSIRDWALQHINSIRSHVSEYASTSEDKFSHMLVDLMPGILVTRNYETLNNRHDKTELPIVPLRAPLAGRFCLGTKDERPKLYISTASVDRWCQENGVSPHQFRKELTAARIIRTPDDKISSYKYLARGVPTLLAGKCRVLEFDANMALGTIEEGIKAAAMVERITGYIDDEEDAA